MRCAVLVLVSHIAVSPAQQLLPSVGTERGQSLVDMHVSDE